MKYKMKNFKLRNWNTHSFDVINTSIGVNHTSYYLCIIVELCKKY